MANLVLMEENRGRKIRRNYWLRAAFAVSFIFYIGTVTVHAQDAGQNQDAGQSQDPNLKHPVTKDQKRLAKKEKERAKASKKATKAALKQHMKDQTPEVRKRMKRNAREADRNNRHKREFFIKRWFTKKKP